MNQQRPYLTLADASTIVGEDSRSMVVGDAMVNDHPIKVVVGA